MNLIGESSIKSTIFSISSLFIAFGFLAIGYAMIMTFIGVYLKQNGSSDIIIGLINSLFFAGAILASIFSQKIIQTVGHIRSFSIFAAIMVITFLCHSVFLNEFVWAALRLISGFAYYSLLIILESWLHEKSQNEFRGQIVAIYTATFFLASTIGQVILNYGGGIKKEYVFILGSILILVSIILIAITKMKEPIIAPFERYSLPKLGSIAPLALLGSFSSGIMVGGFLTMMPLYIMNSFNSIENLVGFMICSLLGGLIAQFPIGKLSDRFGRRIVISFVAFFVSIVSALFLLYSHLESFIFLFGALLGMGVFCIYPLSVARANDVNNNKHNTVEISRSLLFIYAIGACMSPIIIGICFNAFGYPSIFIIYSTLSLILCLYALSKEKVPSEQLTVFVEAPAVCADILPELDPRQDKNWVEDIKQKNN